MLFILLTSLDKINAIPEAPLHKPISDQIIQTQPEYVQMAKQQPIQQKIIPSDPINKAESEIINNTFQQMQVKHSILGKQTIKSPIQQFEIIPTQNNK